MAALDARVVAALRALPEWEPGPAFLQQVMERVSVRPADLAAAVPQHPSVRAVAARRRVMIGAAVTGGLVTAGFVWAFANPGEASALVSPALRDVGQSLWLSLQGITANALEQPWMSGARDLFATPGRAAPVLIGVGGGYLIVLLGFRRLLTRPAAHAAR